MTNYPEKLEYFISKWKPQILHGPPLHTTNEKSRRRRKMYGEWEIFAAVIARKKGQFLIVRERRTGSHRGGWSILGGAVEKGEGVEAGAIREAREEAGISVKLLRPTALLTMTIKAPTEENLEYALALFNARITGGSMVPSDKKEIVEARLANRDEIELLIRNGQFPRMHPNIDKSIVGFFREVADLRN